MSTNARLAVFGRPLRAAVLSMAVLAVGMVGSLAAQPAAGGLPAIRPELEQLKSRVEQRFQVLLLRQGFVLVPRSPVTGVGSIEVSDGAVLLDGSPVTGVELKQRVGADADLVVQLSYLDAAARRRLFEGPKPAAAREPEAQATGASKSSESPGAAAPPESRFPEDESDSRRERVRYGGARVRIGSDVRIGENEEVGSDVVAILGSIYVDGKVNGEVVAVGGSVYLGPKADVRGDVTSVGGGIERSADARVSGQINEVKVTIPSVRPYVHFSPWRDWTWWTTPFGASVELVGTLVRIGLIGLLAAIVVAVFPMPVRRVSERVSAEPWRAALTGLVAQVLFVPLLVLTVVVLAVSIIGIPLLLLVPFALVAVLAALLLGFAGVGCAVGERIRGRGTGEVRNLVVPLVVGLAIIWALTLVARFVGLAGMPLRAVVGGVLVIGFVVEYVAWTMGLGGVLLSRFGRREPPRGLYDPPPPASEEPGSMANSTAPGLSKRDRLGVVHNHEMHFDDLSLPIDVVLTPASSLDVDALVVPVFEGEGVTPLVGLGPTAFGRLSDAITSKEFTAKPGTLFVTPADDSTWRPRRIVLVGLGSRSSYTADRSRRAATAAALAIRDRKLRRLAVLLSGACAAADEAQAVAEGLTLAAYHAGSYKTDPESKPLSLHALIVMPERTSRDTAEAARERAGRGSVLGECSNLARALANEPGNAITPATFAQAAVDVAQGFGLGIDVLEEDQLAAFNMGLLLGVARGSAERPRMVVLRYEPEHPRPGVLLGLVGKGVTFDAGGISLKPADRMHEMKDDMSGGAAVVAAMKAIAVLKPDVQVTGIVPLVENMPGGRALKPGDVLRSAEGKTIEVLNTDAEGRLILGDALWYARKLGATHLVDVATLTGAIGVALGRTTTGLFGSPDWWTDLIQRTAGRAGDRTWVMPMFEDYREQLRSDIADLSNVGGRQAGAITAAMFLKEFAGGLPWAHLDIGGTAWAEEAQPHQPKGPTGVAVRTLVELAFTADAWPADVSGKAS